MDHVMPRSARSMLAGLVCLWSLFFAGNGLAEAVEADPEDARWEQAIQDALALEALEPKPVNATRPEPLRGIDNPDQRLEIYRRSIALFSSDPPREALELPNDLTEARRIAREVLTYGGAETLPALLDALEQPNAQLRWTAIDLLEQRGRAGLNALHEAALNDPDGGVRSTAVSAMRAIEAPESVPVLIQALEDTDQNVVIRSAWALGDFGDPAALEPLATQLRKKEQPAWFAICDAMMEIDADFSRAIVVPYAQAARPRDRNEDNNRRNLLERAGRERYGGGLPIGIPKELETARSRAAGAYTLAGEQYGEDEIEVLIAYINDENYKTAQACIDALVHLDARQAIPHLIEATGEEPTNAYNRRAQFRALAAFGGDHAIRAIVSAYREHMEPGGRNRTSVFDALYALKDLGHASVPLIMPMLDDPNFFYTKRLEVWDQQELIVRGHAALSMLSDVLQCKRTINLANGLRDPALVDPAAEISSMKMWWAASQTGFVSGDPIPAPPEVTEYKFESPLLLN